MSGLMMLFILPFIVSLLILVLPRHPKFLKVAAIALSLIPLLMLAYKNLDWIGTKVNYAWLPTLSIQFYLYVDELSLLFLFLTALIIPISIFSASSQKLSFPHVFYSFVLFLEGLLIGFFTARDLVLFTIFWEAMLIPLYFLINLWGGALKQQAALKFLIYMLAGSALMVAAVLSLYLESLGANNHGTFDLDLLARISEATPQAAWLGAIFMLAFAVKTPLFPFHAWLPDAYYQASTPATILLSAILSKAGIYGIIRISLGLFPSLLEQWSPLLLGWAIAGVLYGGLAAWMQKDYKRLIAYSSFSHVNFILAGLFVWSQTAHAGSILQALNHGVTIAALFLVAGWLQDRLGSTAINSASGLAKIMPKLCWLTLFFVLSAVALPGMNNFVGEVMILFGLFVENPWLAAVLGLTIILSVIYMLRWMQKMYFGPISPLQSDWRDISSKEIAVALPLILLVLWIGLYPQPVLNLINAMTSLEKSQ